MSTLKIKRAEGSEGENHLEEVFSALIPLMEELEVLKTCRLVIKSGIQFASVMSQEETKSLENFDLIVDVSISYEDWMYICGRIMEMQCLKKLTIRFPDYDESKWWFMNGFQTVVEHFADTLESLTGQPLPMFNSKSFPKLREVQNGCLTSISEFSYPVERYPLLKKATFVHTGEDCDYSCDDVEKSGIEEFHFSYIANFNFRNPYESIPFLGVTGTLFRNVSIFSLHISGWVEITGNTINDIFKAAPHLTSLKLEVNLKDDKILSGMIGIRKHPLENVPRSVSLLDFPNLEELEFGSDVLITRDMLKLCLSRMSQLKYLALHLNGDVSVHDLREFVGHLQLVTIMTLDKIDDEFMEDTERPSIMLPSGGEIRTKNRKN